MRVLVSGASGLVGTALVRSLEAEGHDVVRLVRRSPASGGGEVAWDPDADGLDPAGLAGVEAAVHLAGENIGAGRWTPEKKQRIRDSREGGTALLSRTLAGLTPLPRVLVSASAVGIYGDRGGETLTEESPAGKGFLADVCRAWETATAPAAEAGIRVVLARFGAVLTPEGGALQKMMQPFRLGLGGKFGSGAQWMSWAAIDDVVGAIEHALAVDALAGPVNVVAPRPVTNAEFARTLGRVLERPAALPAPAFALRLLLGEVADELLLASQRALPTRLVNSGYTFRAPELEGALREMLER